MSKNIEVMYSRISDEWRTPWHIYDYFVNVVKCVDLFPYNGVDKNGNVINQFDINYKNRLLFCNPPFSKMKYVADYIIRQFNFGNTIYLLVPSRTDTKWFHKLLSLSPTILFICGRLHYNDSKRVAPFPSLLMILDHKCDLRLWSNDSLRTLPFGCLPYDVF